MVQFVQKSYHVGTHTCPCICICEFSFIFWKYFFLQKQILPRYGRLSHFSRIGIVTLLSLLQKKQLTSLSAHSSQHIRDIESKEPSSTSLCIFHKTFQFTACSGFCPSGDLGRELFFRAERFIFLRLVRKMTKSIAFFSHKSILFNHSIL